MAAVDGSKTGIKARWLIHAKKKKKVIQKRGSFAAYRNEKMEEATKERSCKEQVQSQP